MCGGWGGGCLGKLRACFRYASTGIALVVELQVGIRGATSVWFALAVSVGITSSHIIVLLGSVVGEIWGTRGGGWGRLLVTSCFVCLQLQ